jgi:hypothetical protein
MFWRATGAFLISPLAVSIGMLLTTRPESQSLQDQAIEVLLVAFVWYLYPLMFTIVFAVPLYLLLNRFDLIRWWVSVGAGLLVGGIGAASWGGPGLWLNGRLVVFGGIAGLVFWRIISTYEPPKATW